MINAVNGLAGTPSSSPLNPGQSSQPSIVSGASGPIVAHAGPVTSAAPTMGGADTPLVNKKKRKFSLKWLLVGLVAVVLVVGLGVGLYEQGVVQNILPRAAGTCTGAGPCSITCNGHTYSDSCPANGAFSSCSQWAAQACGGAPQPPPATGSNNNCSTDQKNSAGTACLAGCCGSDGECSSGQKCNIGNGACKSGKSCNPNSAGGTHKTCVNNQCSNQPCPNNAASCADTCSTNTQCSVGTEPAPVTPAPVGANTCNSSSITAVSCRGVTIGADCNTAITGFRAGYASCQKGSTNTTDGSNNCGCVISTNGTGIIGDTCTQDPNCGNGLFCRLSQSPNVCRPDSERTLADDGTCTASQVSYGTPSLCSSKVTQSGGTCVGDTLGTLRCYQPAGTVDHSNVCATNVSPSNVACNGVTAGNPGNGFPGSHCNKLSVFSSGAGAGYADCSLIPNTPTANGASCTSGNTCSSTYCDLTTHLCAANPAAASTGTTNQCVNPGGGTIGTYNKYVCDKCQLTTGSDGVVAYRCNTLVQTSTQALTLSAGQCGQVDEINTSGNYCGYINDQTGYTCGQPQCQGTPPSSPSTPPSGPQCLSISMTNVSKNGSAVSGAAGTGVVSGANIPTIGDAVTFTCGTVSGANHYVFQVVQPDNHTTTLSATGATSTSYTITESGKYYAQCQICTGVAASTCHSFESIPASTP